MTVNLYRKPQISQCHRVVVLEPVGLAYRERHFASHFRMLVQQLSALVRERIHNDQAQWNRMMVSLRTPYLLQAETAAAVDGDIQNHPVPLEALEESDELIWWSPKPFWLKTLRD